MTLTDVQAFTAARRLWRTNLHRELNDCPKGEQEAAITLVREMAAALGDNWKDGLEAEAAFAVFLLWMGDAPTH